MTKKMPISFFTFVLPISTTISSFKTQTSLKFFPQYQSYHLLFAYFFSQNIVQNPQIKLRKTETKHLKRITFFPPFVTKVSTHLKSKNFLSSSKSFFVFTYPRILGHELASEILEIGENDRGLKAGDKVVVMPYISDKNKNICYTETISVIYRNVQH